MTARAVGLHAFPQSVGRANIGNAEIDTALRRGLNRLHAVDHAAHGAAHGGPVGIVEVHRQRTRVGEVHDRGVLPGQFISAFVHGHAVRFHCVCDSLAQAKARV